jgi:hypothetical protein
VPRPSDSFAEEGNRNNLVQHCSLISTPYTAVCFASHSIFDIPLRLLDTAVFQYHHHHYHRHHHHHHWLDSHTWALAFLRSFCQLKYPAIASSDFVTRVFSRVGL